MALSSMLILALASLGAHALPTRRQSTGPTVTLTTGTYEGFTNDTIDWFLGVQYAQPPTGPLRFKQAVPAEEFTGTRSATQWPNECPQISQLVNLGTTARPPAAEDCLDVNVMRPSGIPYSTKLPVLVWIYGGAFNNGSSSQYNPTPIIQQSVAMGKPIMFASMNYRLGAFGFLYHPLVTTGDDVNVGLTDQTAALQFLQANLDAWGGDPTQVTIWGESAGGFSSQAQTLYAPQGLFRASIVDSGYIIYGAQYPDLTAASFWKLSDATGCGNALTTTPEAAYTCLQAIPYDTLLNAAHDLADSGQAGWSPSITGNFLNSSPRTRISSGQQNKVPIIIGTNRDDGATFAGDQIHDFFTLAAGLSIFPNSNPVIGVQLATEYVNDPTTQGWTYIEIGRAATTDAAFQSDRRFISGLLSQTQPVHDYWFAQPPPGAYGDTWGAFHAADLLFLFGVWSTVTYDGQTDPPISAADAAAFQLLQEQMIGYWVSFVHDLDVNSAGAYPIWPQYDPADPLDMQFQKSNTTVIADTFRAAETAEIAEVEAVF